METKNHWYDTLLEPEPDWIRNIMIRIRGSGAISIKMIRIRNTGTVNPSAPRPPYHLLQGAGGLRQFAGHLLLLLLQTLDPTLKRRPRTFIQSINNSFYSINSILCTLFRLSICPSVCLSVCLSIHLYLEIPSTLSSVAVTALPDPSRP